MAVLDSTFLIALERGDATAWMRLEKLQEQAEPLRIPAAAWVEYLFPMAPTTRAKAVRELEGALTLEPFTRELADAAARLQHELRRDGATLGWHDLQVAATALERHEPVVTTDRAFARVPGLAVLDH